jgi:hypothetical protein
MNRCVIWLDNVPNDSLSSTCIVSDGVFRYILDCMRLQKYDRGQHLGSDDIRPQVCKSDHTNFRPDCVGTPTTVILMFLVSYYFGAAANSPTEEVVALVCRQFFLM